MANGLTEAEELELLQLKAKAGASSPSAMSALADPNQGFSQATPAKPVDEVVGGKSFLGSFADTINPINTIKGAARMGADVIETGMDFLPIVDSSLGGVPILKPLAMREALESDSLREGLDAMNPMERLFDRFVEGVPEDQKGAKKRELVTNALLGLATPGGPLAKGFSSLAGGEVENQVEQVMGTAPDTPLAQDAGEFLGSATTMSLSNALINRIGSKMGRTRMEVGRRADKYRAITDKDQLRADALSTTQKDFTTRINRQTGEKYNTINDIVGEVDDIFEVPSRGPSGRNRENVWTDVHENLTDAKDVAYRTTENILDNLDIPEGHAVKVGDLGLEELAQAGETGLTGASSEAASRVASRELLQLSKKLDDTVQMPRRVKRGGKIRIVHETVPARQAFQELHGRKFSYDSPTRTTNTGVKLNPAEEALYQNLKNRVLSIKLEPPEVRKIRSDFDSRGKFRDGIAVSETENAATYRDLAAKARNLEGEMVEKFGKGSDAADYQAAKKRYSILAELDEDVMKLDIESRRKFRDGVQTKRDINAGAGEDFTVGPANLSKFGRAITGETNFNRNFNDPEALLNMSNDVMGFERPLKQNAAAQRRAGYYDAVTPAYEAMMKTGVAPTALSNVTTNEGQVNPSPISPQGLLEALGPAMAQAEEPPIEERSFDSGETFRRTHRYPLDQLEQVLTGTPEGQKILEETQGAGPYMANTPDGWDFPLDVLRRDGIFGLWGRDAMLSVTPEQFAEAMMAPPFQQKPHQGPFPRNLEYIRKHPNDFLEKVLDMTVGMPGDVALLRDAEVAVEEKSDMLARKAMGNLAKSIKGLFEPSQHQSMIDGVIVDPRERERFREELTQKYDRGEIDSSSLAKQISELNSTGRVIFEPQVQTKTPGQKVSKEDGRSSLERLSSKFEKTPIGERRNYSY